MALTIDCGEGRHAVCSGRGSSHYLIPQLDGEAFMCGCSCHADPQTDSPSGACPADAAASTERRLGRPEDDRRHVYVVASKVIAADWPKGDCLRCGRPLREHEKRVSSLAPPGTGYVIDEEMLRV